jgi:hypothetical protein
MVVEKKKSAGPAKESEQTINKRKEVVKALNAGISGAIVDIKASLDGPLEGELSRNGYTRLLDSGGPKTRSSRRNMSDTLENKVSLWTWNRSQGTCSGRLKPIIDMQLSSEGMSTDFVISGYTCDPVSISGQWLWTKRATTEEEEQDAIIDLRVTTGRMKDQSDAIWNSPGPDWVRIDGNFTKTMFGSTDSFVWFKTHRRRSPDSHFASPIRYAVSLPEEVREMKIVSAIRLALRHHVPVADMKRLASLVHDGHTHPHGDGAAPLWKDSRVFGRIEWRTLRPCITTMTRKTA